MGTPGETRSTQEVLRLAALQQPTLSTVVLTNATTGNHMYETTCILPCFVVASDSSWAHVPVKELSVLTDQGPQSFQHWYIARHATQGEEVNLVVHFKWPTFTNVLYDLQGNRLEPRSSERRWRKEFRAHAETYHYQLPPAMQHMTPEVVNRFKAWILQVWAGNWRHHRARKDNNRFWGRFREPVVENLADILRITDDEAESVLLEFEELNMGVYLDLLRFLWLPDH